MKEITLTPVAYVTNSRLAPEDDNWGSVTSEITLAVHIPDEAFDGIEAFSHLEIIYYFDRLNPAKMIYSGIPRENPAYPRMGIFAQRKKDRPNSLGLCTVELLKHTGRHITVKNLDAINGTPVLDIKPVFKEFMPKGEIRQAAWVSDLMKHYW
ncbi:MAG: SAM-dependent methyltransferase [Bacteroidetes bacterium]|nr:SAM-dependent methyltransferase [Bacteroidota bacterium]